MRDRPILTYILEDKKPVPCKDLLQWSLWIDDPKNIQVAFTEYQGIQISTVFMGRNSSVYSDLLVLFETMVFGSKSLMDEYSQRYCTWEDASDGHWAIVALIKSGITERTIDQN